MSGHQFRQLNRHAQDRKNKANTYTRNYNRSFSLRPRSPKGSAVLVHGLTDSPYSVRSIAAILEMQELTTYVPRLPGHGFAVGALRHPKWQDWMAVLTLAMKEADSTRGAGQPLILGGYSNGALLSLKYALECQQNDDLVCPDAILLLSPAIKVSPFARLAKLNALVSWLPHFEQFQWESIYPEVDPYKFTSFPKSPGWETALLTWSLEDAITGGDVQLPRILAFQSVVDATVNAGALLTFFGMLRANNHRLVFYDVNRTEAISDWLTIEKLNLDRLEQTAHYEFSIEILSNAGTGSKEIEKLRLIEGQTQLKHDAMEVTWPGGIYSLSHIAIPFSPQDETYGINGSSVGALAPRGERKVLYLSPDYFLRLRYNPFFNWQKAEIETWLQSIIQSTPQLGSEHS